MKKTTLVVLLMITFGVYAVYQRIGSENAAPIIAENRQNSSISATQNSQPKNSQQNPPVGSSKTQPPAQSLQGQYKDGQYTGDVADAYYGNVQVEVTISGGKISDVQFLDYPQDRENSVYINSQAMPYLKQEAIQAQSANVDVVSGATATSQAFMQSLASALAKAS